MAFDHEIVDRPPMHQHQELYDLLQAEAQRRLDRLTTRVRPATRLRHYLLAMPLSRIPEMSTAAHDLGMSERSFWRQLAAVRAFKRWTGMTPSEYRRRVEA